MFSSSPTYKNNQDIDPLMFWSATALLCLGLVMVYSASVAFADGSRLSGHNSTYFLTRHAIFLLLGITAGTVAFQVPMWRWQKWAGPLFLISFISIILVLVPGIGRDVNGARRWIPLGIANWQPSEMVKMATVLFAADYTTRKLHYMKSFKRAFLPMASLIIMVGFLLLKEPDFGAFVVVFCIAFGILFLGGLNILIFLALGIVSVFGVAILVLSSPYRRARMFNFADPWQDALGSGYQLSHSLIAFGRGEIFGVGLGGSVEKLFYLPEAHTDFLLAVIGEELGLVGVLTVICLFATLFYKAFWVGKRAHKLGLHFNGLVAQGIGIWLGFQSFINMGVNVGLLPTKGLTMPLMSFGGSGLLMNCVALGILFKIDWELKNGVTDSAKNGFRNVTS